MAVWIKLSRVPSHCIKTRFGIGFLRYFGEVLDISLFGSRGRDAVFIKDLVRIGLLASFLGRRQACGPDNVMFWVRLHYENIFVHVLSLWVSGPFIFKVSSLGCSF
ncbi:hypothetical protein LINPERHAP2_LOCUS7367 [Linum perenne]